MVKISLTILVAILIVIGFVLFWPKTGLTPSKPTEPVFCTMEAKLCPDGSAVGRVGPNCEFAACPATR